MHIVICIFTVCTCILICIHVAYRYLLRVIIDKDVSMYMVNSKSTTYILLYYDIVFTYFLNLYFDSITK